MTSFGMWPQGIQSCVKKKETEAGRPKLRFQCPTWRTDKPHLDPLATEWLQKNQKNRGTVFLGNEALGLLFNQLLKLLVQRYAENCETLQSGNPLVNGIRVGLSAENTGIITLTQNWFVKRVITSSNLNWRSSAYDMVLHSMKYLMEKSTWNGKVQIEKSFRRSSSVVFSSLAFE